MGGIYGFVKDRIEKDNAESLLLQMANSMSFRGQHQDVYCSGNIAMGLAVYGYEPGKSVVMSRDKSVIAVCEGEIYNQRELLQSLKQPPSDGEELQGFELVPFLYQEQGRDFARALNGVFAIALWDLSEKRLFLVRDHLGSHSVFYHCSGSSIVFGSTIKSLFCHDHVNAEVDIDSLDQYLASLAVTPPATIFKHISAVRPGYAVIFKGGQPEEYAYWPLETVTEDRGPTRQDFAARLRELFEDAVAIRACHGNRCGALISGGVDTSAVVAALFEKAHLKNLQGFSIAFNEKAFSDAALQQIMYDRYHVQAHQIILRPDDFADGLIKGSAFLDSPVNDVAYSGMYNVLRAAADQGCEVVFEGEGSDEIFCTGHSRSELEIQKYLVIPFALRRLLFGPFVGQFSEGATLWNKVTRRLARIGMSDLQRRSTWVPCFSQKTRDRLLMRESGEPRDILRSARDFYSRTQLKDAINIYQYGLTRLFLADDLLYKNERMAAGAGVINRTPFIDYRLVEEAFRVPAEYKLTLPSPESDGTKLIFKDAARGLVPDSILDRKKTRGFSQPTAVWYHTDLKNFAQDHLLDPNAKLLNWLDRKEVHAICADFWSGRITNDYFMNSLLILELWMRSHV